MDFRQRLEQSRMPLADSEPSIEAAIASPYFAKDRSKNPICLELRLPNGSRKALPYSYFTEMNFDIDAGIEILTLQKRIIITGRNLASLFDHLLTYRIRYVQADIGNDMVEDGVFVGEIRIEEQ